MKESLAIRFSRTIPKAAKVTTVTVSKDPAGRYFVSMLCDDSVAAMPNVPGKVGIDKWIRRVSAVLVVVRSFQVAFYG